MSRVRHFDSIAKIEVPEEKLPELLRQRTELIREFQQLGFPQIEIDREGFVSGKLNRVLK